MTRRHRRKPAPSLALWVTEAQLLPPEPRRAAVRSRTWGGTGEALSPALPGIEGVRNNYLGRGGLSYCPGRPAYPVHRPSLLSALTLRMAAGAVRDERSLAPYYLQDKHLTFQDGVSGLTQPLLDLLPRDFSSPSPPTRGTHHPLTCPILSHLQGKSVANVVETHGQPGLDLGPGFCFFQSFATEQCTNLSASLHLCP